MTGAVLGADEAARLIVGREARLLLTPAEIAKFAVVPLEVGENAVVLAADPAAREQAARHLRIHHGLRTTTFRPTSREVFEQILDLHFRPWWSEKGWAFPGLPPNPEELPEIPEPPPAPPPVAVEPAPAIAPREVGRDAHPVILLVEDDEARQQALTTLLLADACELRFAGTCDEIGRELRRAPPSRIVIRRDGPVSPGEVVPLVGNAAGGPELRIVDTSAALIGDAAADDRLPRFLFDLVRFFVGIVAAAGDGQVGRTEALARHAERAARRLGLCESEIEAARLAAVLGDLDEHLERLLGGSRSGATGALAPLLEASRTPYPVADALACRAERYDGSGPAGLAGEEIPAPARVLAAVDALLGLRDEGVDSAEVEARLRQDSGVALDPRVVEAVLRSDRAERLVDRLGEAGPRERVLLIEPDPVAASLLELRLSNAGFDVEIHREGASALEAALKSPPVLIFSEIAVPGLDGFSLLLRLRREEATADIPFLFVTERADRSATVRGIELGADDVIAKPADLELLMAKAKALVRKNRARRPAAGAAAGVSGDLSEMEIVDLLQVLAVSGRTVRIRLEGPDSAIGEFGLDHGKLVDARAGPEEGIPALHQLLGWREGHFTVTSAAPMGRTIDIPLESILLEAARLQDEAAR